MLTKKGKYGLKAMTALSAQPAGTAVLVADLAQAHQIPKKFLDAILGELRTAGFLHAKKGRGGGYRLARPPEDIRVGELIRTLDGPLAPIACASRSGYQRCEDCPDENACSTRLLMVQVGEAIAGVVDGLSLAELRDLAQDPFDSFVYTI